VEKNWKSLGVLEETNKREGMASFGQCFKRDFEEPRD